MWAFEACSLLRQNSRFTQCFLYGEGTTGVAMRSRGNSSLSYKAPGALLRGADSNRTPMWTRKAHNVFQQAG